MCYVTLKQIVLFVCIDGREAKFNDQIPFFLIDKILRSITNPVMSPNITKPPATLPTAAAMLTITD